LYLKKLYEKRPNNSTKHLIMYMLIACSGRKGGEMSKAMKKNLKELSASIRENLPKVEYVLSSGGPKPSRAIAISAAKYYSALNRLAKE
jgi:hypothetical protein